MSKSQSQNFLEPLFKEVQNSILKKETENEDSNKKIDWNKQKHEIDPFINQHELNRIFQQKDQQKQQSKLVQIRSNSDANQIKKTKSISSDLPAVDLIELQNSINQKIYHTQVIDKVKKRIKEEKLDTYEFADKESVLKRLKDKHIIQESKEVCFSVINQFRALKARMQQLIPYVNANTVCEELAGSIWRNRRKNNLRKQLQDLQESKNNNNNGEKQEEEEKQECLKADDFSLFKNNYDGYIKQFKTNYKFYETLIKENKIKLNDVKEHKNCLGEEIKKTQNQIKLFQEFVKASIQQFREQRRQEFESTLLLQPKKYRWFAQFKYNEEQPKKVKKVEEKKETKKKRRRNQIDSEPQQQQQEKNNIELENCIKEEQQEVNQESSNQETSNKDPKNMEELIYDDEFQKKLEVLKGELEEKDKMLRTQNQQLTQEFQQSVMQEDQIFSDIQNFKSKKALLVVTLKEYLFKILKEPKFLSMRLKKSGLDILLSDYCFVIKEVQQDWLPASLENESKYYILRTMKIQQNISQAKEDIHEILNNLSLDKQINYSEKRSSVSPQTQIQSFCNKLSSNHQSFILDQDEQFELSLGNSYCLDKNSSALLQEKIFLLNQLQNDYITYRKYELNRMYKSSLGKISSSKSYQIVKQNFIYLIGIEEAESYYTKFLEEIRRNELAQMKNNSNAQQENSLNTQQDFKEKYLKKKLMPSQVLSQEKAFQWYQNQMENMQNSFPLHSNNSYQQIL